MTLFVTRNFLEDMALIMFVAALAANLCQWMRQPLMVGYLITGIVVGPNVPGLYANPERIQSVSNLGVILLVFSIGLEFKFRRLLRLAPTAGFVAVVQAASMILLGYLVARLRGGEMILRMHFGISRQASTLEELSQQFSLRRGLLRQIEVQALRKLRERG